MRLPDQQVLESLPSTSTTNSSTTTACNVTIPEGHSNINSQPSITQSSLTGGQIVNGNYVQSRTGGTLILLD